MKDEFENILANNPMVRDGIYDVTGIEYICVNNNDLPSAMEFVKKHPGFYIASSYGTTATILFAEKPREFTGGACGSGFNLGSTNIISDCPKNILILAQND